MSILFRMMEGQQINQYYLEKLLGVGGFGGVFQASEVVRDRVLKQLAIKIIPDSSDAKLDELLAAVNLDHPQIIRSYGAGECKLLNTEMLYLAMELAEGTLQDRLKKGQFTTEELQKIITQIASALVYLHQNRGVHRDLKPANILSIKESWKITDFGIAKQLNNKTSTQTSNPIGTISYMPPEAFDGKISPAWDIWSLGIILVEMLTGKIPYEFNTETELLILIHNGNLKIPPLPQEFETLVLGCLERDRSKRWTAEQVLNMMVETKIAPFTNSNNADFYYKRGVERYKLGDKQCAIEDYNKAISLNHNYANAYNNRGVVRYELGDKKRAIEDYSQAISLAPNYSTAYYNRGIIRYDLADLKGAIEDYNQAISLNHNNANAYYNRGIIRDKLGDKQGAIEDYNQAISLNPNEANAYYNRGIVRKSLDISIIR